MIVELLNENELDVETIKYYIEAIDNEEIIFTVKELIYQWAS